MFFLYKLVFVIFNNNRTLGMIITKTYWQEEYSLKKQLLHSVLYTASFSTLLFWVYFPFDLFIANILILQIPTILLKNMTFHEYLSGGMKAIKKS